MAKEMKEESDLKIFLDKEKIVEAISKDGQYVTDDVKIKKWEGSEGTESYLIEMAKSNIRYNGVLNKIFERDGYGIHEFSNGDKYFGFFKEDKRNFNGIYFWPSEEKNGRKYSEMYYGFWRDNHKDSNGIYLWLDEPSNNNDQNFDNTNLEAYVGQFEEGTYSIGTFLQKTEDDYYLYYGKFTKNGQKNDDNGFFYSSKFDRLFHGKIENDDFVEGYVFFFHSTLDLDLSKFPPMKVKYNPSKDALESLNYKQGHQFIYCGEDAICLIGQLNILLLNAFT